MNIELVALADLEPDSENAREHPEKSIEAIKKSLEMFGQRKPIVVSPDGIIIAGNGTYVAALGLGWSEIAVARVPEDWDRDKWTAYAIADNRASDFSDWNDQVLAQQLVELGDGFDLSFLGFSADDLQKVLRISQAETVGVTDTEAEWTGMPDYEQDDRQAPYRSSIHFRTDADADEFFELIGRKKARTVWWPESDGLVGSNLNEQYVVDE
jgi:hypothetical protein